MSDFEKKASKEIQKFLFDLVGEEAVEIIKERVSKGIGIDDAPMLPYKDKKKQGVRDLEDTGQMLGSLSYKKNNDTLTIYFTNGSAEKKAYLNELRTPWFGLSLNDQKKLLERVNKKWMNKS